MACCAGRGRGSTGIALNIAMLLAVGALVLCGAGGSADWRDTNAVFSLARSRNRSAGMPGREHEALMRRMRRRWRRCCTR